MWASHCGLLADDSHKRPSPNGRGGKMCGRSYWITNRAAKQRADCRRKSPKPLGFPSWALSVPCPTWLRRIRKTSFGSFAGRIPSIGLISNKSSLRAASAASTVKSHSSHARPFSQFVTQVSFQENFIVRVGSRKMPIAAKPGRLPSLVVRSP